MTPNEIEERFVELETIVAEHERTIRDLNDIVAAQALTIDKLERDLEVLIRLADTAGVKPLSEETPPPHY